VDPRAGLDDVEKRKFLILPELELRPLGRPARGQSLYQLRNPGSQTQFKLRTSQGDPLCATLTLNNTIMGYRLHGGRLSRKQRDKYPITGPSESLEILKEEERKGG
jgi:hypothetical protein